MSKNKKLFAAVEDLEGSMSHDLPELTVTEQDKFDEKHANDQDNEPGTIKGKVFTDDEMFGEMNHEAGISGEKAVEGYEVGLPSKNLPGPLGGAKKHKRQLTLIELGVIGAVSGMGALFAVSKVAAAKKKKEELNAQISETETVIKQAVDEAVKDGSMTEEEAKEVKSFKGKKLLKAIAENASKPFKKLMKKKEVDSAVGDLIDETEELGQMVDEAKVKEKNISMEDFDELNDSDEEEADDVSPIDLDDDSDEEDGAEDAGEESEETTESEEETESGEIDFDEPATDEELGGDDSDESEDPDVTEEIDGDDVDEVATSDDSVDDVLEQAADADEELSDDVEVLEEGQKQKAAIEDFLTMLQDVRVTGGLDKGGARIARASLEGFAERLGCPLEQLGLPAMEDFESEFGSYMGRQQATEEFISKVKQFVANIGKKLAQVGQKIAQVSKKIYVLIAGSRKKLTAKIEKVIKFANAAKGLNATVAAESINAGYFGDALVAYDQDLKPVEAAKMISGVSKAIGQSWLPEKTVQAYQAIFDSYEKADRDYGKALDSANLTKALAGGATMVLGSAGGVAMAMSKKKDSNMIAAAGIASIFGATVAAYVGAGLSEYKAAKGQQAYDDRIFVTDLEVAKSAAEFAKRELSPIKGMSEIQAEFAKERLGITIDTNDVGGNQVPVSKVFGFNKVLPGSRMLVTYVPNIPADFFKEDATWDELNHAVDAREDYGHQLIKIKSGKKPAETAPVMNIAEIIAVANELKVSVQSLDKVLNKVGMVSSLVDQIVKTATSQSNVAASDALDKAIANVRSQIEEAAKAEGREGVASKLKGKISDAYKIHKAIVKEREKARLLKQREIANLHAVIRNLAEPGKTYSRYVVNYGDKLLDYCAKSLAAHNVSKKELKAAIKEAAAEHITVGEGAEA